VKVAEISRTELKRLDVRFNTILKNSSEWTWGAVNGGARFPDVLFEPDSVRVPVFNGIAPYGPVIDERGRTGCITNEMCRLAGRHFGHLIAGLPGVNISAVAVCRGAAAMTCE